MNPGFRWLRRFCAAAGCWAAAAGASADSQRKVVADFEDFGSWRMRESGGLKPGAWWPGEVNLSGSDAAKGRDQLVGELRFAFGPAGAGPFFAGFERFKMSQTSGFLDGIEWEADANGLPVSLRFQIQDSANKTFTTKPVALTGEGWRHYRLDLTAETMPGFAQCKFPGRLKRVTVEAAAPVAGSVFLDDLALTGRFAKKDRLSVTPIYEKISHLPEEDVTLRYRLRNAQTEDSAGTLQIDVKDFDGRSLVRRQLPFSIPAAGSTEVSVPVGGFPLGAYEVALDLKAGTLEVREQDHFVVMVPNAGRPNKRPMWFGIGDGSGWQGDLENRRHWEWMHDLGVDINRMEIFADRFEPEEGMINEEGWRKRIQGHADAGVDIMVLYSTTPKWAHTNWKWRYPPDLPEKFEAHARRLGWFLKEFPNVTYLEFWNEPDLEFFHGTLDEYLAMLGQFSKGFRASHPALPLTSGGVTVQHPREKEGFSKGMYQRAGSLYDIAAYHAHGPLINTEVRHEQVEKWLKEAGLENKRLFNTETGDRSLYTADGRRRQAITLAKKIIFSKAQPNFDAFFWFTLQDYWDMDPEADDSFGLVTSDNRAKASFAVYNTLIRQLANTTPVADAPQGKDLTLYAFRHDDGRYVYAGWPVETKSSALLWIRTARNVAVCDLFGTVRNYEPLGGIVPVSLGSLPLYLSGAAPGEQIALCPEGEEFLRMEAEIRFSEPGTAVAIPVAFRNPTGENLSGNFVLKEDSGREVARKSFQAAAGQEVAWAPEVIPASIPPGGGLRLELAIDGRQEGFVFPVRLIESHAIRQVAPLARDPASWPALDGVPTLTVDRPEQVFELAYDPNTPAWKGAGDLSATARVVHDGEGIRFQIAVTDDGEGPAQPKDQMWRGDDVQVAFGRADAKKFTILDLGRSVDGPVVWCSEHEDPRRIGQWDVPFRMTKSGPVTTYDVFLPFDQLGLSKKDKNLRFSFLINENDGHGRVRWIEWTPGIARVRSIEALGHGQLE